MASKDKKNSHSSCIVLPFTQLSFMALLWLFQICIYYRTNKPDFASCLGGTTAKATYFRVLLSGGRAIKPGWFQAIFQHFQPTMGIILRSPSCHYGLQRKRKIFVFRFFFNFSFFGEKWRTKNEKSIFFIFSQISFDLGDFEDIFCRFSTIIWSFLNWDLR